MRRGAPAIVGPTSSPAQISFISSSIASRALAAAAQLHSARFVVVIAGAEADAEGVRRPAGESIDTVRCFASKACGAQRAEQDGRRESDPLVTARRRHATSGS